MGGGGEWVSKRGPDFAHGFSSDASDGACAAHTPKAVEAARVDRCLSV